MIHPCVICSGGIGKQLHTKLNALGAHVKVIASRLPEEFPEEGTIGTHDTHFAQFAYDADVLAICCSQNSSNIGMVNKEFLKHFKKNGLLIINVARVSLHVFKLSPVEYLSNHRAVFCIIHQCGVD